MEKTLSKISSPAQEDFIFRYPIFKDTPTHQLVTRFSGPVKYQPVLDSKPLVLELVSPGIQSHFEQVPIRCWCTNFQNRQNPQNNPLGRINPIQTYPRYKEFTADPNKSVRY